MYVMPACLQMYMHDYALVCMYMYMRVCVYMFISIFAYVSILLLHTFVQNVPETRAGSRDPISVLAVSC